MGYLRARGGGEWLFKGTMAHIHAAGHVQREVIESWSSVGVITEALHHLIYHYLGASSRPIPLCLQAVFVCASQHFRFL